MPWVQLDHTLNSNQVVDMLGFLPQIVSSLDPRPIKEQVNANYPHGGGWHPFGAGQWKFDAAHKTLKYPGDPLFKPIAELQVRDELFIVYQHAWTVIMQKDGTYEVSRMD